MDLNTNLAKVRFDLKGHWFNQSHQTVYKFKPTDDDVDCPIFFRFV